MTPEEELKHMEQAFSTHILSSVLGFYDEKTHRRVVEAEIAEIKDDKFVLKVKWN